MLCYNISEKGITLKKKVALDVVGCKLNQAETEALARKFAENGYLVVPGDDTTDIYILNTCTVTGIADRKSRHLLRMARRNNPGALTVALGCYTQRAASELEKEEYIDLLVDNQQKENLVEIIKKIMPPEDIGISASGVKRGRSFIKIQDGCDNFCAYCVVPFVRSIKKCLPPEEIITQVKQRVVEGYREAVLTGTEIGGYESFGLKLKGLIERILKETDTERLRLSSLQTQHISRELASLWQNPRLCRHFHLALQSGSDSVLKRMKRRYTVGDYERAVGVIRDIAPDAAITTDIIVGFPGETDKEFEESYRFCKRMEFARIHVFPFSRRPGTAAAEMPGQSKDKVKRERRDKMLALAERSSNRFMERFSGKVVKVLWEQQKGVYWSGLTGNYIRVYTRSDKDLTNQITEVTLGEVWRSGMRATPSPSL